MRHLRLIAVTALVVLVVAMSCSRPGGSGSDNGAADQDSGSPESQYEPSGVALPAGSTQPGSSSPAPAGSASADVPPQSGVTDEPAPAAAGAILPPEWPSDIPVYEGLTLRTGQKAGETGYMIAAVGEVPMQEVLDFYHSLPGWEMVDELSSTDSSGRPIESRDYTRGAEELEVYVQGTSAGILLRLTYYDRSET